jgi:hypothetical protein
MENDECHDGGAYSRLSFHVDNGFIETEANMNAITISIVAIVITAALAVISPIGRHVEHKSVAGSDHHAAWVARV